MSQMRRQYNINATTVTEENRIHRVSQYQQKQKTGTEYLCQYQDRYRPPKPQPFQKPLQNNKPLTFKFKKNKRVIIADDNKRKLRKLMPSKSFVEQCSFPFQSLMNDHKWKRKHLSSRSRSRSTSRSAVTHSTTISSSNIRKKKTDDKYNYCYDLLFNVDLKDNELMNCDELIEKWDNILCGLAFEIIRNMAKNELSRSISISAQQTLLKMTQNKENKYFLKMDELNIAYRWLFNNNMIEKYYWRNSSRLNSLFSYISWIEDEDENECFVLNDDIRYNALSMKCAHKLYLWPNGFSYHTMDNLHSYDAVAPSFMDLIDQCIVPTQWINDIKRDSFNKKFFKEQQYMRYERAINAEKFRNDSDAFVSVAIERLKNYQQIFKGSTYFEGNLFLELIDFRFVHNSDNIDSYEYKHNCHLQRILLKSSSLHMKESFADIAPFYAKHLKAKHFDALQRIYVIKQRAKYKALNCEYPFYQRYKTQMRNDYHNLLKQMKAKQYEMHQLYKIYTALKKANKFTFSHSLNWDKQNKTLKRLKLSLIQHFYCSYYPLDPYQDPKYIAMYQRLKQNKLNLEKNDNKEYLSLVQREQNRIIKLLSSVVIRNEIEKQILLKIYHNLCLKPSIEVMQVMNYAHYVKDQNLVRSSFNHKQMPHNHKENGVKRMKRNIVIDGINQSQTFLNFIQKNGNEKLFNLLESTRNEIKYLYDRGQENKNDIKEPRKHPGQWIPKYSAAHYQTKCCVLQKYVDNNYLNPLKYEMTVLRIDFVAMESSINMWLHHNGLWVFTISKQYEADNANNIDYQYCINNCNANNIVYSEECLTLNCAAKLLYEHMREQIYNNCAQLLFTQNTLSDDIELKINQSDSDKFELI